MGLLSTTGVARTLKRLWWNLPTGGVRSEDEITAAESDEERV
jgi:hypothetical protein